MLLMSQSRTFLQTLSIFENGTFAIGNQVCSENPHLTLTGTSSKRQIAK